MNKRISDGFIWIYCMGPVSSEDQFPGRSIAAKIFNLKLNETLHLTLHSDLASYFTLPTNKYTKIWEIDKG